MLTTQEIINKYNLFTKKSFGQNFLTNPELLSKIAKSCDFLSGYNVLEIGTGPCGLTTAILKENPKKLITIDADERCVEIAKNELCPVYNNVEAIFADALNIDENKLFNGEKFSIIANLPYNIGTVLLFKWLNNNVNNINQMVFLLQKEVVERIVAKPSTKEYGKISIVCQYLCNTEKCFDIKPSAFFPPPKVVSTVVKITPKQNININIAEKLIKLVDVAFLQRRKTLYNNLKNYTSNIKDILNSLSIKENARPEELSIDDFLNILRLINK